MTDEQERGRFEGEVLTRLDALRDMGMEIKTCQYSMKVEIKELAQRVSHLEHLETRLKMIAALCGTIAAAFVAVIVKMIFKQ